MIKLLTDSTANVPKHIIDDYEITVLPTYVHFGSETLRDGVDLTTDQFYKRLAASPELPSTSQISVADFSTTYGKLMAGFPEATILSIHVSGKLSGIIESARGAATAMPGANIHIFDTESISIGHGLMVHEAARMARLDKPLAEIVMQMEAMRQGMNLYWVVDTLEYLAKSGRIGRAARFLGTMLDMKPILRLKDGAIDAFERQRSRPRALNRMRDLILENAKGKAGVQIGIMHAACEDDARKFADELRTDLTPEILLLGEIGPSVGVYTGPGAICVAWYRPAT